MTRGEILKKSYEDHFGSPKYEKSNCHHTYEEIIFKAMDEYAKHLEEKAFNAAKCGIVIKRTTADGSFSANDITPVNTIEEYRNHPDYQLYLQSKLNQP